MDIEVTNEEEEFRELTNTGSKQYRTYGNEYKQSQHVAGYGLESPTRASSGEAKSPHRTAPSMLATNRRCEDEFLETHTSWVMVMDKLK